MKKRFEYEVHISPEQRSFAAAALSLLPPELKNPQVAAMLAEALQDPDVAKQLQKNPKSIFKRCGCTVPKGVTVKVHLSDKKNIQLSLPTDLAKKKSSRRLKISDDDLISEGLAAGALKNSPTNTPISKTTDDVFAGDHGDLGPPISNKKDSGIFKDSGNMWDGLRGDDV